MSRSSSAASGNFLFRRQHVLSSRRIKQHSLHRTLFVHFKRHSNRQLHYKEVALAFSTQPTLRNTPAHRRLDCQESALSRNLKYPYVRRFVFARIASQYVSANVDLLVLSDHRVFQWEGRLQHVACDVADSAKLIREDDDPHPTPRIPGHCARVSPGE